MFSAADFRFFAKISQNVYKDLPKCLQRMFFGSHLKSIICKTKNTCVRVRYARRPLAACIPPHPIPLYT